MVRPAGALWLAHVPPGMAGDELVTLMSTRYVHDGPTGQHMARVPITGL